MKPIRSYSVGVKPSIVTIVIFILTIFEFEFNVCSAINCDKVVRVESKELFSYLGNVTFAVPNTFSGHWKLAIKTDVPFAFIGGWGVRIKEDGINGVAEFQNTDATDLKPGDAISFRFRVSWAPRKPLPKIQKMVWEDHLICNNEVNARAVNTNVKRKLRKSSKSNRGMRDRST